MFKYLISFMLLAGCVSRPSPTSEPQGDLCAMLHDPHLCILTINDKTFAGQGSNKCLALRELRQTLLENKHNPLLIEQAECGRVFR